MKKILSLILVFGIMMSLIPVGNVFAKDEYVFFDSFEAGIANWDFTGGGNPDSAKTVLGKSTDGKMGLCVKDQVSDSIVGIQSKVIKVKPGSTYFVEADIYHEEAKALLLQVNVVGAGGKVLSSQTAATASSKKWETASAVVSVPSDATGLVIVLSNSVKTEVGVDYVDNVKVIEGKVTASGTIENIENYGPKAGDAMYHESFEEGLGKFNYSDNKQKECFVIKEDQASDGKASLYFYDDRDDLQVGVGSPYIPINEMRKYRMSVDIFPETGKTQIQLRLYDTNKEMIYRRTQYTEDGTQKWGTYNIDATAYPGAAYFKIIFAGDKEAKPHSYIDNIKITDVGPFGTVDPVSAKLKKDLNYRLSIASPGDVIEVDDGVYQHIDLKIPTSGTAEKPITLKAKNPGKVIFKGLSGIAVTGSYIVIEGLIWENSVKVADILSFKKTSSYCHLNECAFLDCYPEDFTSDQRWAGFAGHHHKITGCYFTGKGAKGLMLELGIEKGVEETGNYLVENCYFGNFKYGGVNGLEVIRTGLSDRWDVYGNSIIRNNFFERCNSEVEIISTKCSGNKIYNNTFYNCNGAVWARHGLDNSYTGNLFIGAEKADRTTGVELYGDNHVVKDNYFYNLPMGSPAILLKDGNPDPAKAGYAQVNEKGDVSNNTIINCDIAIQVGDNEKGDTGKEYPPTPPSVDIKNNAIISYKGTGSQIKKGSPVITGTKYENNVVYGKALGYDGGIESGVTESKIDYTVEDGYIIPANGLGANIEEIKKTPKSPFDVIPDWMKREFYDSGKYKFELVEGDPFNTEFVADSVIPKNDGEIKVMINGIKKEFDVEPQLINSRTMVPMRAIFEEFGADIAWDEATASATASTEFTTVKITENSDVAYANGRELKLDSPAVIINGRFLVPLRFVSESFGASVDWYDDVTTVKITYRAPIGNIYKEVFTPQAPIENALTVYEAIQSNNDGTDRTIRNIFNGGFTDKWPFKPLEDGTPGFGIFDLGSVKTIDKIMLGFAQGNERVYTFDIFVSDDGVNYTLVKMGLHNSGVGIGLETFELGGAKGRYLKYVGHGSNVNSWNNITELFIIGK